MTARLLTPAESAAVKRVVARCYGQAAQERFVDLVEFIIVTCLEDRPVFLALARDRGGRGRPPELDRRWLIEMLTEIYRDYALRNESVTTTPATGLYAGQFFELAALVMRRYEVAAGLPHKFHSALGQEIKRTTRHFVKREFP